MSKPIKKGQKRVSYSVFSKRLKEVKREMLEVMNWGKLFQTAGAAWQNYPA